MNSLQRENMRVLAFKDKNHPFTKGMYDVLRDALAKDRIAKSGLKHVVVPYGLVQEDIDVLEDRFKVTIVAKDHGARSQFSRFVGALVCVVDERLFEMGGSDGRSVMLLDGDTVSLVAKRSTYICVERTGATPRLQASYVMEDLQLQRMARAKADAISSFATTLLSQVVVGEGENFCGSVRPIGRTVDVIVVNHMRTPVGPSQMAYFAGLRGANVVGVFPFQPDMLWSDSGELDCFPGTYHVDRKADLVTFVPREEPSMCFSHPYDSLLGFIYNNSITVEGVEWLVEKYLCEGGLVYYTMKRVGGEFEFNEVLTTRFLDTSSLHVTEISYPRVAFSPSGVPVGWERGMVRMPTERFEKAMYRCMTSSSGLVKPAEVFTALKDYNNTLVNSMDTAVLPLRMSVEDEEAASLAIALKVNWTRHMMSGTLNVLLDAVRMRYDVAGDGVAALAAKAMAAWFTRFLGTGVKVGGLRDDGTLPMDEVVDWMGMEFSVTSEAADPWVVVSQEVGGTEPRVYGATYYPWLPVPRSVTVGKIRRFLAACGVRDKSQRASEFSSGESSGVAKKTKSSRNAVRRLMTRALTPSAVAGSTSAVCLVETAREDVQSWRRVGESSLLSLLKSKMISEQAPSCEVPAGVQLSVFDPGLQANELVVPPPVVDVLTSIKCFVDEVYDKEVLRDFASTSFRLAEGEFSKWTQASLKVNDSLRAIPKGVVVRRCKVEVPVEGKRISSQAALMAAMFKRNVGVPANRGEVNLDEFPVKVVDKFLDVCFVEDWREMLEAQLDTGMWEPCEADIEDYLPQLEPDKAQRLLAEFFSEDEVDLTSWKLMLKNKLKATLDSDAEGKVAQCQTLMYLQNSGTNAYYSAQLRRYKKCFDAMLRPEVRINSQDSPSGMEEWYNSLDAVRKVHLSTHSYAADIFTYDRSQEHAALRCEFQFWKTQGLNKFTVAKWSETMGLKRASSAMLGVVLSVVLSGLSGDWKTLFRNGILNAMALVYSTSITRRSIVMMDIKGDDSDLEFCHPIQVESAVEGLSLNFNFSAKFFTSDVRYMCKYFRVRKWGRWYFVADPWAKVESVCAPQFVGANGDSKLVEKWVSLKDDLRHYDNYVVMSEVAAAAAQYYGKSFSFEPVMCALARLKDERDEFFKLYLSPEVVS